MKDIAGRFNVGSFIGSGSFGSVYNGRDSTTGDLVAIKIEKIVAGSKSTFELEAEIYKTLKGVVGIPNIRWKGKTAVIGSQVMVLDLLGENLHYLSRYRCNGVFSLKTVAIIADHLLQRLQALHERGYIHRDLKPDNFVMGRGNLKHIVHLIDFGVATKLPSHGGYCGYIPFASVRMHRRESLTVRDDLECLGYVLVFLLTGSLPWMRFKGEAAERAILKCKMTAMDTVLKDLHCSFAIVMKYVQYAPVNYTFLRSLFSQIHTSPGQIQNDHVFDWELPGNLVDNRLHKLPPMYVDPLAKALPAKLILTPLLEVSSEVSVAKPVVPTPAAPLALPVVLSKPQTSAPWYYRSRRNVSTGACSVRSKLPVHTEEVAHKSSPAKPAVSADVADNLEASETRLRSACALTDRYSRHCRVARSRSANLLAKASALSRGAQRDEPVVVELM